MGKFATYTAATAAAGADLLLILQGAATKKLTFTSLWAQGVPVAGGFSRSPRCIHTGGIPATQTSDGFNTTPVVTETYYSELFVESNVTITGASLFNGSAVDGLVVAILYNSSGVVVANSLLAGTTQSGTDAYQLIPFTGTYAAVGPATYYLGFQFNDVDARFNTHILGSFVAAKKTGETFGTATTLSLATTFTTALGPIASLY